MTGLCPFHDERTPSFGIDPVEKLYHCFGCGAGGDVFKFVMETEGLDFAARAGVARRALRASSSSARPRTRARPSGAAGASGCWRCSSARPRTTCACCGSPPRRRRRASTSPSAGCEEAALREFRVGYVAARVGPRAAASRRGGLHARRSCSPPGSRRAAATAAACSTASAAGSCSRSPTERGRVLGLRRPGAGAPTSSRSTSTRRRPSSSTRAGWSTAPTSRARRRRAPARRRARRGLHGRDRAAPGRRAGGGVLDGHGADRRRRSHALRAARADRAVLPGPRHRRPGGGGEGARRVRACNAARRRARGRASCGCRPGATRPTSSSRTGRRRCARCSTRAVPVARFEVERALERGDARRRPRAATRAARRRAGDRAARARGCCRTTSSGSSPSRLRMSGEP